jgi:hypothetical protein
MTVLLPISQATEIAAMKTTIDISDALLREARKVAARHGMTLRTLVEQGLRKVLAERSRRVPFRLRKASFKGRGLRPNCAMRHGKTSGISSIRDEAVDRRRNECSRVRLR